MIGTHTYEIRSIRGNRPVFAFDDEVRARAELARAEKRIGTKLALVKIIRFEERIA